MARDRDEGGLTVSKVYVITAGEYSDYHICAVTLDPDNAEWLRKFYDKDSYTGACIEEFDTETVPERFKQGEKVWRVVFCRRGDVEFCVECSDNRADDIYMLVGGAVIVYVWAKDEKSAIKIAAERRAKYLAEKEGIV